MCLISGVPLYVSPTQTPCRTQPSRAWRYRGTSLIRKRLPLRPYSRPMPMVLRRSLGGGGVFVMSEVALTLQSRLHAILKRAESKESGLDFYKDDFRRTLSWESGKTAV